MSQHKNGSFYLEKPLQELVTPDAKTFLLVEWYKYMFPYIPFNTGLMASLMDVPEDTKNIKLSPEQAMLLGIKAIENDPRNVIHFKAPYASVQNNGDNFNFTKDLHQLAQAHWEQVAADLRGEQIINATKKYILSKIKEENK